MKAIFMGTPEVALGCLEATVAWAGGDCAVVTQPDRPRGRSAQPQPPPVKERALALGLEVVQPERIRGDQAFATWLTAGAPEVIVVVAFGQILPADVLTAPALGCVNVHFSLLPKYRGAAPVQWAVINGDRETGLSTMLMDEGLDTGPVLLRERVAIGAKETAGRLFERLAQMAPRVLTETLEELAAGRLTAVPQDESEASLAPRLSRADGELDWRQPASALAARVRGVTPWPGATAELAGETVKVLRATAADEASGEPGQLLTIDPGQGLLIACGAGGLWLHEVQASGRRPVTGAAYANGRRLSPG